MWGNWPVTETTSLRDGRSSGKEVKCFTETTKPSQEDFPSQRNKDYNNTIVHGATLTSIQYSHHSHPFKTKCCTDSKQRTLGARHTASNLSTFSWFLFPQLLQAFVGRWASSDVIPELVQQPHASPSPSNIQANHHKSNHHKVILSLATFCTKSATIKPPASSPTVNWDSTPSTIQGLDEEWQSAL